MNLGRAAAVVAVALAFLAGVTVPADAPTIERFSAAENAVDAWPVDLVVVSLEDEGRLDGWPIEEAARRLSASSELDLRVGDGCPAFGCIRVYEESLVDEEEPERIVLGVAAISPGGQNEPILGATVKFDSAWLPELTPDEAMSTAIHELAHAVGLDHNSHPDSIMQEAIAEGLPVYPGEPDVEELRRLYG